MLLRLRALLSLDVPWALPYPHQAGARASRIWRRYTHFIKWWLRRIGVISAYSSVTTCHRTALRGQQSWEIESLAGQPTLNNNSILWKGERKCWRTSRHLFPISLSACVLSHFSHVRLFDILWTVACQAPLSMGFSRQEFCSGLPCPPPVDLPDPGIEPRSPALAGRFFTISATWEVLVWYFWTSCHFRCPNFTSCLLYKIFKCHESCRAKAKSAYLLCVIQACQGLPRRLKGILFPWYLDGLPGETVCGWSGDDNRYPLPCQMANRMRKELEDGLNLLALQILKGRVGLVVQDENRGRWVRTTLCGSYYYWGSNLPLSLLCTHDFTLQHITYNFILLGNIWPGRWKDR